MPPRKIIKKLTAPPVRISVGSGITAGLEMWRISDKVAIVDTTVDNRFEIDATTWNTAAGLNVDHINILKNAAYKDAT